MTQGSYKKPTLSAGISSTWHLDGTLFLVIQYKKENPDIKGGTTGEPGEALEPL